MINKTNIVESMLTQMFYYDQEQEKCTQEIDLIYHEMKGLKSPNLTGVHGTPEDRQHKLIRLGEKVTALERKRELNKMQYLDLFQRLKLYKIDEFDLDIIEMLYKDRLTCEQVANKIGYSGRKYVSRKRVKIIDHISKML